MVLSSPSSDKPKQLFFFVLLTRLTGNTYFWEIWTGKAQPYYKKLTKVSALPRLRHEPRAALLFYSSSLHLQLARRKNYKEGTNTNEKGYPLCSALFVLQNIPLHKRVNKDAADFPFLLGEGPALSNNLIIHHSLQGKQSGPWKEEQTNEKLSARQPKDNLWALSHRTSPAHRCCTNSITVKSALVKLHSAWLR